MTSMLNGKMKVRVQVKIEPRRKSAREEKVPEWFYKKDEKKTKTDKPVKSSSAIDEERRKLLEELGVTGDGTVK